MTMATSETILVRPVTLDDAPRVTDLWNAPAWAMSTGWVSGGIGGGVDSP